MAEDNGTAYARAPRPAMSATEALEALILLNCRLARDITEAAPLQSRSLSLDGFCVLAELGATPGSSIQKIGKHAAPRGAALRDVAKDLIAAGLIAERADAPKGTPRHALTDQGRETLDAVRKELAAAVTDVRDAGWRAVPRLASLVRGIGKGVSVGKKATATERNAAKAAARAAKPPRAAKPARAAKPERPARAERKAAKQA